MKTAFITALVVALLGIGVAGCATKPSPAIHAWCEDNYKKPFPQCGNGN